MNNSKIQVGDLVEYDPQLARVIHIEDDYKGIAIVLKILNEDSESIHKFYGNTYEIYFQISGIKAKMRDISLIKFNDEINNQII